MTQKICHIIPAFPATFFLTFPTCVRLFYLSYTIHINLRLACIILNVAQTICVTVKFWKFIS